MRNKSIIIYFVIARLILFLSLPVTGLRAYGDLWNFFGIAGLGRPFVNHWVEFPPIFPLINRGLYLLVGGRQHVYDYGFALLMTLVQGFNLYLFSRIAAERFPKNQTRKRVEIYIALMLGIFYGWTYFDPLAVMALLSSVFLIAKKRDDLAGVMMYSCSSLFIKQALKVTLLALAIVLLVWGGLFLTSPEMTKASLLSQVNKGSWESVWALLDGNIRTGNFGADIDRTDPKTAYLSPGNPPLISPWLTLLVLGGFGGWVFLKTDRDQGDQALPFIGLTMVIYFLWSPGYSPQWILYLLPFVFLTLSYRRSILIGLTLVLVHLLEWPLLLSRGLFHGLYLTVMLRTFLFVLLGGVFYQHLKKSRPIRGEIPGD